LSGGAPGVFALSLAGFPAARGTLALRGDALRLVCEVDDSKITPGPAGSAWTGSCVELFFDTSGGTGPVRRATLVPQPDNESHPAGSVTVLDGDVKPLTGLEARYESRPAGYTMHAAIPLAALDIASSASSILFDTLITITALGDAHSGGRTALNGSFESGRESKHFTRLKLKA
jgi:hypothetical protein